jgi:hypothetical protein
MQESAIAWTDDPAVRERFFQKVEKDGHTGCWVWTGASNPRGYGRVRINDVLRHSHRVSYRFHCGPIPDGVQVNHHCDNPPCVNPDHLYTGTQAENLADAKERGGLVENLPRGDKHHRSVLSARDALAICHLYEDTDHTYRSLADLFGVGKGTIQCVLQGDSWAHVTGVGVEQ